MGNIIGTIGVRLKRPAQRLAAVDAVSFVQSRGIRWVDASASRASRPPIETAGRFFVPPTHRLKNAECHPREDRAVRENAWDFTVDGHERPKVIRGPQSARDVVGDSGQDLQLVALMETCEQALPHARVEVVLRRFGVGRTGSCQWRLFLEQAAQEDLGQDGRGRLRQHGFSDQSHDGEGERCRREVLRQPEGLGRGEVLETCYQDSRISPHAWVVGQGTRSGHRPPGVWVDDHHRRGQARARRVRHQPCPP